LTKVAEAEKVIVPEEPPLQEALETATVRVLL
jgi:hypothetical protein